MKFYEFPTSWKKNNKTYQDVVTYIKQKGATTGKYAKLEKQTHESLLTHAYMEQVYIAQNRPHYNIGPKLIKSMIQTKLDQVPANVFQFPPGIDVVNIRLPDNDVTPLKSILLCKGWVSNVYDQPQLAINVVSFFLYTGENDVKDKEAFNCHSLYFNSMQDNSLETCIQKAHEEYSQENNRADLIHMARDCMKIALMARFIHDCGDEELVSYDVLSKYRIKYEEETKDGRVRLEEISRRKGKVGWNIGTNELLYVGPYSRIGNQESGEITGRELTHAHLRSGYLGVVRHGKGKRDIKVKFFRPTVVRPDLPFQD